MIYDMRIYIARPGREEVMRDRFVNIVMPIFERLGIEVVSAFQTTATPPQLVYTTRFKDEAERISRWEAFKSDKEWTEKKTASEVEGPILKEQTITLMTDILDFGND